MPTNMSFSPDNRLLLVRDAATILRIDGTVVLGFGGQGMIVSNDMQTIVTWSQPPHGPGSGNVSAQDGSGKYLWSNFSDDPGIVVTPDGDKIIARVNVQQPTPKEEFYEPQESVLRLFARDGTLLGEFPGLGGRPVAVSPDGRTVLLETGRSLDAIDLSGRLLYSVAADPYAYKIAPDFSAVVVFSWGSDGDLEYFKLK
jgi:hypothetical protein